jgi:hypothetical protein
MADGVERLQLELAELLAVHEPTLTDGERTDLVQLEARCGWRPGSRPSRPEPKISAFLDFFDRAEQQELTDGTLAGGSVDALRLAFREHLVVDA